MSTVYKIVFSTLLFITSSFCCSANISYCACIDGIWGEWQYDYLGQYRFYAPGNELIMYHAMTDRWNYCFRLTMDGFSIPSESVRKQYLKSKTWYEYSGTIEYFLSTSDQTQTLKDVLKRSKIPNYFKEDPNPIIGPGRKVVSKCTIKIAPYERTPRVFNVFVGDCAFGFDFGE